MAGLRMSLLGGGGGWLATGYFCAQQRQRKLVAWRRRLRGGVGAWGARSAAQVG
jgi:hypothetical protein